MRVVELQNKIIELLNNKDFSEKLLLLENDIQVKEHFKIYGVEISDSELENVRKLIFDMVICADKLSDSDLKNVSGGVAVSTMILLGILPTVVGIGTGCVGIPLVVSDMNKTKLQKKIIQENTQKNIASINAKNDSYVQMYKSAEKIAGCAMVGAVLSTGIVCFRKEIKTWWNGKNNKN